MNWAYCASAAFVLLGVAAILFVPSPHKDPKRQVGFIGMVILGLGFLLFLLGLVRT